MELSSSNIKKFLTFSQEKAVLIFQETETPKNFLHYLKRKFFLYFREWNPRIKFFIFQETELP